MKESEAREKKCPIKKIEQAGAIAMQVNSYCDGEQCMMWEAEKVPEDKILDDVKVKTIADAKNLVPEGWTFSHLADGGCINVYRLVNSDSGDCSLKPACYAQDCRL